jgi:tetratricopeptide (TPR) repeat protein
MSQPSAPDNSSLPDPDSESLELKLPDEAVSPKDLGLWVGVLALIALIAYWPATTGSFIWRDDSTAAKVTLLAPSGLSRSWFSRWQTGGGFDRPVYQPVTDTAYWIEYRLGGHDAQGVPAAGSFHIASLVFHAGAAILLWFILRELSVKAAWLSAAVFALHPLHSEPVSWISEQAAVLSGMLLLGSVYTYLMFVKNHSRDHADRAVGGPGIDPAITFGFLAGALVLSIAAMLAEPSALVGPLVIWLLLLWTKKLSSRDTLLLGAPLLIGLGLWLSDCDLHKTAGEQILLHAPLANQLGVLGHGFSRVISKCFLPFGLSILPRWTDSGFTLLVHQAFALLVLVGMVGLYLLQRFIGRGMLVATVVFVLLVGFSLNWFDAARLTAVTGSTAYLSLIPVIVIAMFVLYRLPLPGPQPQAVVVVSTLLLGTLGAIAWNRTYAFENSVALWRDVLQKNPTSPYAQAQLAEQLRVLAIDDSAQDNKDNMERDLNEAIQHAQTALKLDPANGPAQRTWANALVAQGSIAQALSHYETATHLDPDNLALRTEYGDSLNKLGRFTEAKLQLDEALRLDINSAVAHTLLGVAYAGLGDRDRAISEQTAALALDPGNIVALEKLAELQTQVRDFKAAIVSYSHIMASSPDQMKRPDLWVAIARIKDRQGEYDHAVEYLQTAARLAPDNADIEKELANETRKQAHAAATRATTRAATMPATKP